jgi:hypothetical protein
MKDNVQCIISLASHNSPECAICLVQFMHSSNVLILPYFARYDYCLIKGLKRYVLDDYFHANKYKQKWM